MLIYFLFRNIALLLPNFIYYNLLLLLNFNFYLLYRVFNCYVRNIEFIFYECEGVSGFTYFLLVLNGDLIIGDENFGVPSIDVFILFNEVDIRFIYIIFINLWDYKIYLLQIKRSLKIIIWYIIYDKNIIIIL